MNPDASNTIFQKAVSFVNQTGKHLFITGKAGTGKTTFLRYIRENCFKKIAVVAPTGVAAINAGGVTIHSFFQLPPAAFLPAEGGRWGGFNGEINNRSTLLKNLKLRGAKRQVIQELDVLVIDEISMVRADLLDAVDTVMRFVRRQPLTPFGGVQMIYIGDLFQLPPVIKNEEWQILQEYYRSPFFFDSLALQTVPPLFIELKKMYRQKDDVFINILNNIRNNCCTPSDLSRLHQHYDPDFSPKKEENFITLTSHNSKADSINQKELQRLKGKLFSFDAKITGEFYDRSFPADQQLQLKEGAQVMFIKNDKGEERRYYNGKIGTIKRLKSDEIVVSFPNEEEDLEVESEVWQNVKYDYNTEKDTLDEEELGTFTQFPLRLAWAITIHKSQGLTFEKAVIDAGASFAPGQVYVSLSRLTSLDGLVLHSQILPHCISTDQRVIDFVKNEVEEDQLQQTLQHEQKVYVRQSLLQSFSLLKLADAFSTNLEDYGHRLIPDKEKSIRWATGIAKSMNELSEVADKFSKQLEYLFQSCEADNYKKLKERTEAAAKYFVTELHKLYTSVKQHVEVVKVKQKVKKYVKELTILLSMLLRKTEQVKQALKLSEALTKSTDIDALLTMVEQNKKAITEALVTNNVEVKPEKVVKGESSRTSLQMFKQGKSIADIAAERSFSAGTIEAHLAGFISTGEVDILDLVTPQQLNKLMKIIESEPGMTHTEIKEKAHPGVSYATIKAVVNYTEKLKMPAKVEQ